MKRNFQKIYKAIIAFCITGMILIALTYLFRGAVIAPYIQRYLENIIESRLDLRVNIGTASGSYVTNLALSDITTLSPSPIGPLTALELKRIRVSYDLFSFMRGLDGFLADASVEVEGVELELDLSRPGKVTTASEEGDSSQSFFLPEKLPRIRVRDTAVHIKGKGFATALRGIDLEVFHRRHSMSYIRFRASEWSWIHPNLRDGSLSLNAEIEYTREQVIVRKLVMGEKTLSELVQIDLKALPDKLAFNADLSVAAGRLALNGRLDKSDLNADIKAEDIDLARMVSLLSSPELSLSGTVSMEADLLLPMEKPTNFITNLELKLIAAKIYGFAVDELKLKADSKRKAINLNALDLKSGTNSIKLREFKVPSAKVFSGDLDSLMETVQGKFFLECRNIPAILSQTGLKASPILDTIPSHNMLINGSLRDGIVYLNGGSLTTENGDIRLGPSRITLPSMNRSLKDSPVQAKLDINLPDLGAISRIFAIPRLEGSLQGNATVAGTLGAPSGTAVIAAQAIAYQGVPYGHLTATASADTRRAVVESVELQQGQDRLKGRGIFYFESKELEDVELIISVANLADYTHNLLPESQPLTGAINCIVKVSGDFKEPDGLAEIEIENLQVGEFDIPGAVIKARSSGRRIMLREAFAKTPWGQVTLSANILRQPADEHFDVQVTALAIENGKPLLVINHPAQLRFSRNGDLSFKNVSLSGTVGSIRLDGAVAADKTADVRVSISDMNSRGWIESIVADRIVFSGLTANAHFFGPLNSPSLAISGGLEQIAGSKSRFPLSGRFDMSYTKGKLQIRQFNWRGQEEQQITITGTAPIDILGETVLTPGPLSVDATISIPDLGAFDAYYSKFSNTKGSLDAKIHLSGTWDAPSGTVSIKCQDFTPPTEIKPIPPGPFKIDGRIRFTGKNAVIDTLQINSPVLTFSSKGEWIGLPALSGILQGETDKPMGEVSVDGNLNVTDLNWLVEASPALRRVSGQLKAKITAKGPVTNPALDAVVRLTDGELRPDMAVPSIQDLDLEADVTPSRLALNTFTGELGGAPFQISGSIVRGDEDVAQVDLRLQGQNLLYYRSEGLKLRADTDLSVKGPLERLKVTGDVAITDGRLVKYFDFLSTLKGSAKPRTDLGLQLFSFRKPPLSQMIFDVRIESKHPFVIRNNLAKGAVRPELKLIGTGEIPILAGVVYVDPTRINLPAGRLVFESGVVRFDPNRPDRPTLDLVGKSKLLGYDVTVLVEGPYDEPVMTLSSVPPLSNQELLMLLIAGQPPGSSDDPQAAQRQSMNVAVFLGRDLIARWFGSESSEEAESVFDRLDVRVGRAVTRAGEDTIDAQFRIADDVLRDGDRLYITGEKDIFDFYNAGVKIVFRFK